MNFTSFKNELENLKFGKKSDTYLLVGREDFENEKLNSSKLVLTLINKLKIENDFEVLKLHFDQYKICFLKYENFANHAVPKLLEAIHINLATGNIQKLDYNKSNNPAILLEKESILKEKVAKYIQFSDQIKALDLKVSLDEIHYENSWQLLLSTYQLEIDQHKVIVITKENKASLSSTRIKNYECKEEISNFGFSESIICLIENSLISKDLSFFDYGCGLGHDVKGLQILGYDAFGWDPKTKKEGKRKKADIVHLGNVLSDIEDPIARSKALQTAYKYSKSIFIVSCDLASSSGTSQLQAYGDGVITKENNFKKFFEQGELRQYIEDNLGSVEAIAAGPGIFYIFKEKSLHQAILKRSCIRSIDSFQHDFSKIHYSDLIKEYLSLTLKLGRAPVESEFAKIDEVKKEVGSIDQIKRIFKSEIGENMYDKIFDIKRKDLLVYLAVSNFNQRLAKEFIQESIYHDIEAFLEEYETGYQQALSLLYSVADPQVITTLCNQSDIGFKDEKSLYIRMDQHDQLHPVLRIYIGCCERLIGDISKFDLIKVHKESSKLSLMKYTDFYEEMIPKLELRVKINLAYQNIKVFDYSDHKHSQVLYHKVRFFDERWESFEALKKHSDKLTELDITIEDHGPNLTDFQEILKVHGYQDEKEFNSEFLELSN
ncbi:DNA phosphorothioation-associated putative methyltransferase [bacterium]|nr:DNA phosphorothioation-associated putative methyltransferase [bacterium]